MADLPLKHYHSLTNRVRIRYALIEPDDFSGYKMRGSADPDKTQHHIMQDLRVATDKFFMGNENFLPSIGDVSKTFQTQRKTGTAN
jgi:hypothetical protein